MSTVFCWYLRWKNNLQVKKMCMHACSYFYICLCQSCLKQIKKLPREYCPAIALVFSRSTGLRMSFPIRLNSITLRALCTLPFLLTMFPAKMLLNTSQVSKCPWWVIMHTRLLGAHIHPFSYFFACSLL